MDGLVGLDSYSLTGPSGHEICSRDVRELLQKAKELGADGLQCHVPGGEAEVEAAFDLAAELGLYLEPYVQLPIHWTGDAEIIQQRKRKFSLLCSVARDRRIHAVHCTMGARERFSDVGRWKAFVGSTTDCLRELRPELLQSGVRLGIENHWDYSTYELAQIARDAGPDVVGVGFDTGNVLILAEAPDQAVARCAPIAVTTHLKDVMLFSIPTGAARAVVPLGEGQAGVADAVRACLAANPNIRLTIEDHSVIYDTNYFQDDWLKAVPELTTHDIATTARLAHEGDTWLAERRVADLRAVETVPWSVRGPSRLARDITFVKSVVKDVKEVAGGTRG